LKTSDPQKDQVMFKLSFETHNLVERCGLDKYIPFSMMMY